MVVDHIFFFIDRQQKEILLKEKKVQAKGGHVVRQRGYEKQNYQSLNLQVTNISDHYFFQ